jgi:opacity protein-like surface antigen
MKKNGFIFFLLSFAFCTVTAQQQTISYPDAKQGGLNVGAYAGPSLLIETAPDSLAPEIQDFYNQLRSGWHYGFGTDYFFNKYIGIGARYSRFNTKKEADSIVLQIFSQKYYIDISSNMSIHSLSPMVYGRFPFFHNKLSATGGIGPAWLFFRNIGKAVGEESMIKGSLPGLSTSLGISYQIIPNLSLEFQGNYIRAFLKEFTQDNGSSVEVIELEEKDYQNISRIDFSFGIFYTFK